MKARGFPVVASRGSYFADAPVSRSPWQAGVFVTTVWAALTLPEAPFFFIAKGLDFHC